MPHRFITRKKNSLLWRLIFATLVIMPLSLGVIAFALHKAFETSLLNAEKNALQAHFYSLVGVAEPGARALVLPDILAQPEFNQFDSGLYAWISNTNNDIIWRSPSDRLTFSSDVGRLKSKEHRILAGLHNLDLKAGTSHFYKTASSHDGHFIYQYKTVWAMDGVDQNYLFTIAHDTTMYNHELQQFHSTLALWLGLLGSILILSQVIIFYWGLRPLNALASQIKQLELGEASNIKGQYPSELSPIVDNLNHLLAHEKSQRQRYKNTLSDLAHSLKTPLALIRTLTTKQTTAKPVKENQRLNSQIDEQVSRMSDIVDHQLRRASNVSTKVTTSHNRVNFFDIIERLKSSLDKVYFDKQVLATNAVDKSISHFIDTHDAMELFGNILENAYKYCRNKISIDGVQIHGKIEIHISDDGEGVQQSLHQSILKRGARADTATAGQGIGLAISIDILSSYDGSLNYQKSDMGGAMVIIALPTQNDTKHIKN